MSSLPDTQARELLRTKDEDWATEICQVLDEAGITYRFTQTTAVAELNDLGRSDLPTGDFLIMVSPGDWDAARAAIEESDEGAPLPEGHYLHTATTLDLIEILRSPDDWDPIVVSRARSMADKRGISPALVAMQQSLRSNVRYVSQPAPQRWIIGAVFNTILGMLIGWTYLVWVMMSQLFTYQIGYSLVFQKSKTPHGEIPTYDKLAQEWGAKLIFFQLSCSIILLIKHLVFEKYLSR